MISYLIDKPAAVEGIQSPLFPRTVQGPQVGLLRLKLGLPRRPAAVPQPAEIAENNGRSTQDKHPPAGGGPLFEGLAGEMQCSAVCFM